MFEGLAITFPGLVQSGAVGIVFLFVWAILSGRLVPKSSLDREREIGELWKKAYEHKVTEEETRSEALHKALEGLSTVNHLVRVIREIAQGGSDVEVASNNEGYRASARRGSERSSRIRGAIEDHGGFGREGRGPVEEGEG